MDFGDSVTMEVWFSKFDQDNCHDGNSSSLIPQRLPLGHAQTSHGNKLPPQQLNGLATPHGVPQKLCLVPVYTGGRSHTSVTYPGTRTMLLLRSRLSQVLA